MFSFGNILGTPDITKYGFQYFSYQSIMTIPQMTLTNSHT